MYRDWYEISRYIDTTFFRNKRRTVTKLVTKFSFTDITIKYPNISLDSSSAFRTSSAINCTKRKHQSYSPVGVFIFLCELKNFYD